MRGRIGLVCVWNELVRVAKEAGLAVLEDSRKFQEREDVLHDSGHLEGVSEKERKSACREAVSWGRSRRRCPSQPAMDREHGSQRKTDKEASLVFRRTTLSKIIYRDRCRRLKGRNEQTVK